ncbi:molybdenum ABC transporter ATP-binding protein [Pseudooceanicola marinus]|uniref:molybdenum ABC transporter ATP-binding protein n=1 Tax=Pseudooceanicola marinus TaxID=396013 RepID=UPI001CD5686B|nr:molybdenum ABC transporter ATP-binding protein [Pseudooceanicola marinus]MCA1335177.1 molybdenum ABC transporter ATP-binding protein [Pseudooceanicola marinus]
MSLSVSLHHDFGGFALDVDFRAPPGLTVLFGRSGSGKTSVIKAVAGLLHPDAGRIATADRVLFDGVTGRALPVHRRRIGYIFQEPRLFPHLSVRRNLTYGRRFAPRRGDRAEVDRVVEMLGLGALLDRRPGGLSGGEQSRVSIGRALLSAPEILLADEPLAALDEARKAEILPYFERLRDETDIPILYVSHSVQEVARLATTVVAMEQGRVTRAGPAVEVFADPAFSPTGPRDAGALIEARILTHHADGLTEVQAGPARLHLPRTPGTPGDPLRLRIAAQDVMLAREAPQGLSALNILPGTVTAIREDAGPGVLISLTTPAGPILAAITRRSLAAMGLTTGTPCHAIIKSVAIAQREDPRVG